MSLVREHAEPSRPAEIEVGPSPIVPARAPAATSKVRPEIQALRAAAVSLVVAYHLWPSAVPGGFVGVDVFFAISGFLITSLLLREIDRSGTISLASFWARRARRILPAALLMLLICGVATLAVVPETSWPQFLSEVRASTVYVQNDASEIVPERSISRRSNDVIRNPEIAKKTSTPTNPPGTADGQRW